MSLRWRFVILAVTAVIVTLTQIAVQKQRRTRKGIAESLLANLFSFAVGFGGVFAFAGHTMRAAPGAASIGWAAGNPFQYEVAFGMLLERATAIG